MNKAERKRLILALAKTITDRMISNEYPERWTAKEIREHFADLAQSVRWNGGLVGDQQRLYENDLLINNF